jgi:hypothetical protein
MKRVHLGPLVVVASMFAGPLIGQGAGPSSPADPILSASRGGKGLCIHIAAGGGANPELVALLASGSKMLVHGLALDDASLDRARKHGQSHRQDAVAHYHAHP